jgi:hypothetical protein
MGVQNCIIKTDSKVIAARIEKECITKDTTRDKYLALITRIENYFKGFSVEHIERNKNTEVDELAKATVRKTPLPPDVFFQTIEDSLVKTIEAEPRMLNVIQGEDWQALIMTYLHHYELDNSTKLIRMQQRAKAYQIIENTLYKSSITGPLLRYLSKSEGKELLAEIHTGVCRGHIGSRKIIVDNAKQSDCDLFKKFCYQMGTEEAFASVYHLQSNGAVE